MKESKVEEKLIREAQKRGIWALKSEVMCPGFPDRILFCPGSRVFLVETKSPGKRFRKAQKLISKHLKRMGFSVYKIDHPDEVEEFFGKWVD